MENVADADISSAVLVNLRTVLCIVLDGKDEQIGGPENIADLLSHRKGALHNGDVGVVYLGLGTAVDLLCSALQNHLVDGICLKQLGNHEGKGGGNDCGQYQATMGSFD